jgi:glycosyltransferase involved in cell wall biosynthesis
MTAVSVVIPAFNAAHTIAGTLKALQAQVDAPQFELIVVDNASTDDTAEVARACGATVLHEQRRGPAAARNCGLHHAGGSIIAHLDADTVPSRRWLAELCAPFASGEVFVAGNTLCYPPRTAAERYAQVAGLYSAQRTIARDEFPFAPSLNMAVRRDAALAVGGWNIQLLTSEDVDFSHRLLKTCAKRIYYSEKAIVYHRTRTDAQALRRQAIGYGAGAAELYRMYPDELHWDVAKTLTLVGLVVGKSALGLAAGLGAAIGVVDRRKAEFLAYQAFWTRSFWLGFGRRALDARRGIAW